jgi:hypothetical protein
VKTTFLSGLAFAARRMKGFLQKNKAQIGYLPEETFSCFPLPPCRALEGSTIFFLTMAKNSIALKG